MTKTYSFSSGQSGLVFIGITVGCIFGAILSIVVDHVVTTKANTTQPGAPMEPEHHLRGAILGNLVMPGALFWFAWTARPGVHWIVNIIASGFFDCANILIFVH
jgi:hypothetical protein